MPVWPVTPARSNRQTSQEGTEGMQTPHSEPQNAQSQVVVTEQFQEYEDVAVFAFQREIKTLRLQHASQQRKLIQLLEEVKTTPVTITYNVKWQCLLDLKDKQKAIVERITALDPTDLELDLADDEAFSKVCIQLDTLIASGTPSTAPVPVASVTSSSHHLNVPMPTFDGTYAQWPKFKAMFSDIVQNSGASDAIKLHHLNKALVGKASGILNASIIAGNNFVSAWQLLEDRFENPRVIVDGHIAGLLQMKPLTKETARGLRELMETCKTHIDGLSYMKKSIEGTSDLIVTHILASCFDPETRKLWERTMTRGQFPDLKSTLEFLCQQCDVLEQCTTDKEEKSKGAGTKAYTTSVQECRLCRAYQHAITQCPDFLALSTTEKQAKAQSLHLCYNCLGSGHSSSKCQSKRNCRHCNRRHHTLLHLERNNDAAGMAGSVPSASTQSSQAVPTTSQPIRNHLSPQVVLSVNGEATSTVLLSTVVINIMDNQGIEHHARALLDSGSQSNFVSGRLAQLLRLPRKLVNIPLSGIGGSSHVNVRHSVRATIRSRCSEDTFFVDMLVLPKPTANLPTRTVNISNWNIPAEYVLADPKFNQPGSVDIILGAELFYDFLKERRISFGEHRPVLQESKFGWIVSGTAPIEVTAEPTVCMAAIDDLMKKFFDIEELSDEPSWSLEERACEEFYCETTTRDNTGKYIVRLPRKPQTSGKLGDSRSIALRRFLAIERRLQREPETRKAYIEFMDEYQRMGHMSKIEVADTAGETFYMPHHPVFKVDSTTTKCRVVFDAPSKSSNGLSLNDTLMVGPTIQQDATSILLRFRTYTIGLTADVAKMYRQVWVHPEDRALQRILWRKSPDEPIQEYQLNTVTYGTASAPFLAIRSLKQTCNDHGNEFPVAAARTADFYVDDFVSGADSVEQARGLQKEVEQLYQKGGFPLRKWASNEPSVLTGIDNSNLATSPFTSTENEGPLSTLGVVWIPSSDELQFKVCDTELKGVLTKRKVASCIARIYDPLGIIDPVKAVAKQMLRHIWSLKKDESQTWGWDDELPPSLQQQWMQFQDQLTHLKHLKIPRVAVAAKSIEVQLHFFCDASEQGYGACCYLRSINETGDINIQLFASKTKVAPLKVKHSIARLELCAAQLAGQLYERVKKATRYKCTSTFWTDSMTVIHWLRSPPNRWKPFVGNRVSQIQQLTQGSSWRHIPGIENPADLASRGCSCIDLLNSPLWWQGPSWIRSPQHEWPQPPLSYENRDAIEEQRTSLVAYPMAEMTPHRIFSLYSSYSKLRRILAYWIQFFNRRHNRRSYDKMGLTTADLKDSEDQLCRLAQLECFKSELKALQHNQLVATTSKLKWFNPQLGADGLIRIGGRLENASLSMDAKHPVIVPGNLPLASMIMKHYHLTQLHASPQLMLSISRQRFWIINGRNLARKVYHACYTCFRARPPSTNTLMGDLPSGRVNAARPFSISGVDYCGPLMVKGTHRRAVSTKAYAAIFVCFIIRAVHIELVSNLTTEAFLSALRRFVARRGLPSEIHSDNATNFKGASNHLNEVYRMLHSEQRLQPINTWTLEHGITWKFIPPRAPHFGGLWEAAVKSMKTHLVRVLGASTLSFEDMTTLLAEIECCLNSRPITALTDDPSDTNALTPGHFLIGSHMKNIPDVISSDTPCNRLNHWRQVQQLKRRFWNRWHNEYLQLLQGRHKWLKSTSPKIEVGSLVLIREENTPSCRWPLARITKVYPGKDGICRVATVLTSKGTTITRPIVKLCMLPKLD